jgi:ubiquinone/menaquinone biosynthesis C-methylase UbiE
VCLAGLGADIYSDGFLNITNVDISSVVVSQMTSMYAQFDEMEYSTMDARRMEFIPYCCFDVIIDKALFDSMLCGEENTSDVQQLVTEMWRILKPGGVYLLVSHGAAPSRLPHLSANQASYQWSIQHFELRKLNHCFIFFQCMAHNEVPRCYALF